MPQVVCQKELLILSPSQKKRTMLLLAHSFSLGGMGERIGRKSQNSWVQIKTV